MSSDKLGSAIELARSGDKAGARRLLESILQQEPRNETAWIWMTDVVGTDLEKRVCLKQILSFNPNNFIAKEGLRQLEARLSSFDVSSASSPESTSTAQGNVS